MISAREARDQTLRAVGNTDEIKKILETIDLLSQKGIGGIDQLVLSKEQAKYLETHGFDVRPFMSLDGGTKQIYIINWI